MLRSMTSGPTQLLRFSPCGLEGVIIDTEGFRHTFRTMQQGLSLVDRLLAQGGLSQAWADTFREKIRGSDIPGHVPGNQVIGSGHGIVASIASLHEVHQTLQ